MVKDNDTWPAGSLNTCGAPLGFLYVSTTDINHSGDGGPMTIRAASITAVRRHGPGSQVFVGIERHVVHEKYEEVFRRIQEADIPYVKGKTPLDDTPGVIPLRKKGKL